MRDSLQAHVAALIELARLQHDTEIEIREVLTSGKSGAFVAKVDCSGKIDGVFILKIGTIAQGWPDEEQSHRDALRIGAFSGKVPKINFCVRSKTHYALVLGLAGDSIIQCKPLATGLNFFNSVYTALVDLIWNDSLISLGDTQSGPELLSRSLGYRLDAKEGRIFSNAISVLGKEIVSAPCFAFHGKVLPNPLYYANCDHGKGFHKIRAALGPMHGDCHAHNIFIKSNLFGNIDDIFLIDLESFQEKGILFFDFSYLEIATLLRHMDGIGDVRWLSLARRLITDVEALPLEPNERGWAQDIIKGRERAQELSAKTYPNRRDDLRQQRLLADVAAGLSFLNKRPRQGEGSIGLSTAQYRQAMIWSAVALDELFTIAGAPSYPASATPVPVLAPASTETGSGEGIDWKEVGHFDGAGFNVLVIGPGDRLMGETLAADWSLVIDFGREAAAEKFPPNQLKRYRQAWPRGETPDPKFLKKGAIWYYADGRVDISDAQPSTSTGDWRSKYRRYLEDFLSSLSRAISPPCVRILIFQQEMGSSVLRMVFEAISDAFSPETVSAVLIGEAGDASRIDVAISVQTASLAATLEMIREMRDPAPPALSERLVPSRVDGGIALVPLSQDIFDRVSHDLTLLSRGLAENIPEGRVFGLDFLRGMPIEWAELDQDIDVDRAAYKALAADVSEALQANSNRTVNLTHEASAGGTTLSRRIAWDLMEKYPAVILDQLTTDTAAYLREIFGFTSLPVLVVMEASRIKETEREELLRALREDNTRAAFLWVSRTYNGDSNAKLASTLTLGEGGEAEHFLDAYLRQTDAPDRVEALRNLVKTNNPRERSPFFFGLTAFRKEYRGIEKMVAEVILTVKTPAQRALLGDLALVSLYSQRGLLTADFDELCERLNGGEWPIERNSLYVVEVDRHVRFAHVLLAELVLSSLARVPQEWRIDLGLYSENLIKHLRMLRAHDSDRVRDLIEEVFITRGREGTSHTETTGGGSRRYSPLVYDIGNVETARAILNKIVLAWPDEPHFAAHLARHFFYEEPREIERAIELAVEAEKSGDGDAILAHVVGMAYRIRMDARLIEAKSAGDSLDSIECGVQDDYRAAVAAFDRSMKGGGNSSHSLVSKVQMSFEMLKKTMELAKVKSLGEFLKRPRREWYLEALSETETAVDILKRSPQFDRSTLVQRVLAEWDLVYGRHDAVIGSLRTLARTREDPGVRRALCAAIIAKWKHDWRHIPASDLRTIVQMTEQNIVERGVLDTDVRRWLNAYRRLSNFDIATAIDRLVDWSDINPSAIEPPFYLYIFYFLRWLSAPAPRDAYAVQVLKWLNKCQANRPFGQRTWSYEWLVKTKTGSSISNFRDLPLDPSAVLREGKSNEESKLVGLLSRVNGVVSSYRGPQQAELDLGNHLKARITPLDRLAKNDEGAKASAYIAFSYDGLIGWDAKKSD